jgi:CheY-like chemotaxis protein
MNVLAHTENLILVVDDDALLRKLLCLELSQKGYHVAEACNGLECLEFCKHFHPDLIILDGQMPVMDGFTCCEHLNAVPDEHKMPILMLTGLRDEALKQRAIAAGVADYLTKPCNLNFLLHHVQDLLQVC